MFAPRFAQVEAAGALEEWLTAVAEREFVTSLEDDERELAERQLHYARPPAHDPAYTNFPKYPNPGDEEGMLLAIVAYRVQRKRLWRVALDVLAAHRETHSSASSI